MAEETTNAEITDAEILELLGDGKTDATPEVEKILLERKLDLWKNTLADSRIDYQTAKALKDDALEKVAITNAKRAVTAIRHLEAELLQVAIKVKEAELARLGKRLAAEEQKVFDKLAQVGDKPKD